MATAQLAVVPESAPGGALLNDREVSALTGVRLETLKYLWIIGEGPSYTEEHGAVRCTLADVLKWQAERRAAHSRLMASYRQVDTVPALVGFASGVSERPRIASIGNGIYCRTGRSKRA
jgi:hypothetical protein